MRTDPFRDFDRLADAVFGTQSRPVSMPMDAYLQGDVFVVALDLPGVDADSIDLTVEQAKPRKIEIDRTHTQHQLAG